MTNVPKFLKQIGTKLHDLVYDNNSAKRYLTPEEAKQAADNAQIAMKRMNENLAWAQIQVNAEIEMIRMLPEGDPRIKQHRNKLKLRLVTQQYMEKMAMTMEMVNSQIELSQMTAEMGTALKDANAAINTYNRDMPRFTGFVRDFMKTVAPMNQALNGGLDEMSKALDELCGMTLDGVFSEEEIDRMIAGTPVKAEPAVAKAPVAAEPVAQPVAAAPVAPAKPAANDLLASIEAELGSWKSKNT